MEPKRKIAVCSVSGGLDSCTAASLMKRQGYELYLLSIKGIKPQSKPR
jgi:7-cyano-7-deazaguanine synthase in queuosine biosynthesis